MFIKYGSAKIIATYESEVGLLEVKPELEKILESFKVIKLDPQRYFYLRNRSVSSLETWGPNKNGDAFPRQELKDRHFTFVNSRVSVDHRDEIIVGVVIDSYFVNPKVEYEGDRIIKSGDYVENILALDKKVLESYKPDGKHSLYQLIMDGIVTDTSMGAIVGYSICSVPTCMNVAHTEDEYCEHIRFKKNSMIRLASGLDIQVYEICRDISFFEDSIIVPLQYGGLAGGEGADAMAKFLEKIATTPLKNYVVYRDKLIKTQQVEEQKPIYVPEQKVLRKEFKDEDIKYTQERIKKNIEEELGQAVEVVKVEKEEMDKVYNYLIELLKKGVSFDEALKLAWEHFKGMIEKKSQREKISVILVDVDDTVMDVSHRLHYIESPTGKKDWESFFSEEEVKKDKVKSKVVEKIKEVQKERGLPVVVLTGRPEYLREITVKQLKDAGLEFTDLIMKPIEKRFEKDISFKPSVLKEYEPVVVFDDKESVLEAIHHIFPEAELYLVEGEDVRRYEPKKEGMLKSEVVRKTFWKKVSFKKGGNYEKYK